MNKESFDAFKDHLIREMDSKESEGLTISREIVMEIIKDLESILIN